ncbi:hypothetical protein JCGZ_17691 [Jatropha curcas]|uniref:Cupin type-1 domain-containing protein n=1 Tax=Jatropha curcas TaxID=180498 RepID=A0A067JUM5_JATCU|nr:hypothetical protein JCGZ_17691 [Jatropha curcas]
MATTKLALLSLLSLLAFAAGAKFYDPRAPTEAQQCHLQRITTTQPSHRIDSEGGETEIWDPSEDQFQCAGVAAYRDRIQPNSLSLPKFLPAPRLVYVIQGRGVLGLSYPSGCPQTFHAEQQSRGGESQTGARHDPHQKIRRIRRGDIIAIPHGAVDWCYNDGNEELVAVTVVHLNNRHNQLDQYLRAFLLGGGQSRQRERESPERPLRSIRARKSEKIRETFQNVFRSLDEQALAESFNVPTEIVRRMQAGNNRGTIIRCDKEMRTIVPDEREEEEFTYSRPGQSGRWMNGMEEAMCTMKTIHNLESRREADFYTKEAGRIHLANQRKLPILSFMDMSAERGVLLPRAMHSPHWSINDQRIVCALRGDMHIQIVDDSGNTVMDERVKEGDMFVIPQFYAALGRAGENGFEYVTFKTSSQPIKSPLAGYTSVMRAMPLDVLMNSYRMSPSEAHQVKRNRDPQSMLFTPTSRRP